MGLALFIVVEDESKIGDCLVDGKAVAANEPALEKIAKALNVTPLIDFYGNAAEDMLDLLGEDEFADMGMDASETPKRSWFAAAEGLRTVQAIIEHLQSKPESIEDAERVLFDLKQYEDVLTRARDAGVRFCFGMDV